LFQFTSIHQKITVGDSVVFIENFKNKLKVKLQFVFVDDLIWEEKLLMGQ